MTTTPVIIDRVSRVAPFGVRFLDTVTRSTVGDGLVVTAYRTSQPDRRFAASLNQANTFVLQNVPGLSELEFGAGDPVYWDNLPAPMEFTFEVSDRYRRFQPFSFTANLPHRQAFTLTCDSPLEAFSGVPLFSTAARSIPGGFGVIRAELHDIDEYDDRTHTYAPAAWAVLEAYYDGEFMARGVADQQGRLVLIFPYPEPINPPIVSPPGGGRKALAAQQWPIDLIWRYIPIAADIPHVCDVLSQSITTARLTLSPPSNFTQTLAAYGVDNVLMTDHLSEVLISRAP